MAKQFQFSLGRVFNYRKKVEDLKAEDLARSKIRKKNEEEKLDNIEKIKHDILDREDPLENMTLNQLQISSDYILQLDDQIDDVEKRVLEAKTEVKENLDQLSNASKDKKAVEKLLERRVKERKTLEKKLEMKKIDEIAIRRDLNKGENP
tara:strand:+ start:14170 stop:14619 length:450 start_codon:yes stop_codon:yes gene_type:complete